MLDDEDSLRAALDAATSFDFDGFAVVRIGSTWRVVGRNGNYVLSENAPMGRWSMPRDEAIALAQKLARGTL